MNGMFWAVCLGLWLQNAQSRATILTQADSLGTEVSASNSSIFLDLKRDPIWAKDKAFHLSASFFLTNLVMTSLKGRNPSSCGAIVMGVGLAKEIYDWGVKGTGISLYDLFYDFMGVALAMGFGGVP